MSIERRGFLTLLGLGAAAGVAGRPVWAADGYPASPLTVIVPFAPGGGTDLTARMIIPYVQKNLPNQQKIVILNRPGGGGEVGATEIAFAKPDGYTIGFMNVPNTMMKSHSRKTKWTVGSFAPIANMVFDPAALAARADSKFNSLDDVVQAAKKDPGQLLVSSAGVGSNTHLDLLNFESAADIQVTHVPFEGGAASRNALLGSQVDLCASTLGDMKRFAEEGKVKMLGIMTPERFPMAPDVPTYAEQGYSIEGGASRGLVGPKDMSAEQVAIIADAVEKATRDPELIAKLEKISLPIKYMGPDEYGGYLQRSDEGLAQVWKRTPWTQ